MTPSSRRRRPNIKEKKHTRHHKTTHNTSPDQNIVDEIFSLYQQGKLSDCEKRIRSILKQFPDHGFSWKLLGAILNQQGQLENAISAMQKATRLLPHDHETFNNLGVSLKDSGFLTESETTLRHALELNSDFTEAHNNLGVTLLAQGKLTEAKKCFQKAVQLQPNYIEACCNLGICLKDQGYYQDAEYYLKHTLELNPSYAAGYNNLGNLYIGMSRLAEAKNALLKALELKGDFAKAHNNLGNVFQGQGNLKNAENSYLDALKCDPNYSDAFDGLLFVSNYHPDKSAEEIFKLYEEYNRRFGIPLHNKWQPYHNDINPDRRLKIGYVSPAFFKHPVFNFLEPLLKKHDKNHFEIFAYAEVAREDQATLSCKKYVDHWIGTTGMTDDELAKRIRRDKIDILVDLAGHTGKNRLSVFARKPAPVSLHWLDFGYTTGLTAIDYYLTDIHTAPIGSEHLFSEQLWRLPVPPLTYHPTDGMGDVNPLPAHRRGYITFGTLTRSIRLNQHTITAWAKILHRVKNSRLVIDSNNFKDHAMQETLKDSFIVHGIDSSRLDIGYHSPPWDVLRGIDISLDCFPHNSGTTLFECLYMGIPFITYANRPGVGRIGCSILTGIDRREWIAYSIDEYIEITVNLASNFTALTDIRANLRKEIHNSPLMDERRFAVTIEDTYRAMFKKWTETDRLKTSTTVPQSIVSCAAAIYNTGIDYQVNNQIQEAEAAYIQAINIQPNFADAYNNLGVIFQQNQQYDDAVKSLNLAIQLHSNYTDAIFNLANTYKLKPDLFKAEKTYRKVIKLQPDYANAHYNLGNILQEQGRLEEAVASLSQTLELNPDHRNAFSTLLFTLNYHPDKTSEEIFAAYAAYNEKFCIPLQSEWVAHSNSRNPDRTLKIGYIAPNYLKHPARYFLVPLLAHQNKNKTETFAFIDVPPENAHNDPFFLYVDHWISSEKMNDQELCKTIRDHKIDILVDLPGHTSGNRLQVFARKPAPVSLHWLDFGYTTGLTAIDYYLTDTVTVPANNQPYFSETLFNIETPALAYRPPKEEMGLVNSLPALKNRYITFGTLTRAVRINYKTIRVWAKILKANANSRLIINSGSFTYQEMRDRIVDTFSKQGIDKNRLDIGCNSPPWDVLRRIDITLDCFPHNSGTTLIESLYMGVPYITMADRPSVGRIGSSILAGFGHSEWIATSENDYINLATTLGSNLDNLSGIRSKLRQEVTNSPLMDEKGFARKVEAAYSTMFKKWCDNNNSQSTPETTFQQAENYYVQGKFQEAEDLFRQLLVADDTNPDTHYRLGCTAVAKGSPTDALTHFQIAVDACPEKGEYWLGYIDALDKTKQSQAAAELLELAIKAGLKGPEVDTLQHRFKTEKNTSQQPTAKELEEIITLFQQGQTLDVVTSHYLGDILCSQKRFDIAIEVYQRTLETDPDIAESHYALGNIYAGLGQTEHAITCYTRAIEINPHYAEAFNNLANMLQQQNNISLAEKHFRHAVTLNSNYAEAHFNLANILRNQNRLESAEAYYNKAITLKTDYFKAYSNLGITKQMQGDLDGAEKWYRQSLAIQPDFVEALIHLGACLKDQGDYQSSEELYRKAIKRSPHFSIIRSNLGSVLKEQGKILAAEKEFRYALKLTPDNSGAHDNLLFLLNYHPDMSSENIYAEYKRFNVRFGVPYTSEWSSHTNSNPDNRKLRIGYLSPQFKLHSIRHFLEPLLAHHNRQKFELYAYADIHNEDEVSKRYRSYIDHWHTTASITDSALSQQIREDKIDVLVDLAGHTSPNRLGVFARKPAPVSLHWLDFGYTTGLSAIDYYLTDTITVPPDSSHLFSEKPWYIQPPALAYRPAEGMGNISPLPALQQGHITFGLLSRAVRINHKTIRVWAELLKRVEGSRLIIDSNNFRNNAMKEEFVEKFSAHNINPARLTIGYNSPPWDTLRSLDISLDCFPHNSGTTLFESLYMGVPFITLAGRASVGRLGSAILNTINHPEWIAQTEDEYIECGVTLASDMEKLKHIRSHLRQEMETSLLMDEPAFAGNVEDAYTKMFQKWYEEQQ